jgi:hypothetical protein
VGLAIQAPAKPASLNVQAHDAYLRGMYALNKWTGESVPGAIIDFRDAIARDSAFAPAYVALAEALDAALITSDLSAHDAVPEARRAVESSGAGPDSR